MFVKTSFREMVSGVSKDPSSVTTAVETIASVRAEKDLIIAALQGHSALLTKQLEAAMYGINQLARRIFGRSDKSYHHPKQRGIDLGAVTLSRRLIRLWWFYRWLRASLLEKKCHSETQAKTDSRCDEAGASSGSQIIAGTAHVGGWSRADSCRRRNQQTYPF